MENKEFVVDGKNFSNLEGFYNEVEKALTKGVSGKIGRNLNAFNDVLSGGFGAFENDETISLTWKNADKSERDLGWKATESYIEQKLKTCHPTNVEYVKNDLALAREQKGETLFQIIINIIKEHKNIKLTLS